MRHEKSRRFRGIGSTVIIAMILSGCGGMPRIEEGQSIELSTGYMAPSVPEVDVDGDPSTRPGAMAMGALEASATCDWAVIFCAALFVPVAAVSGAAITAADTLPEELAHELNGASWRVAAGMDLPRNFRDAMQAEAARLGLELKHTGADIEIRLVAARFWWEVTVGNEVYLKLRVQASAEHDGKVGVRNLSFKGRPAPVETLLANDGERIGEMFETFMAEASAEIWPRLLDRN